MSWRLTNILLKEKHLHHRIEVITMTNKKFKQSLKPHKNTKYSVKQAVSAISSSLKIVADASSTVTSGMSKNKIS